MIESPSQIINNIIKRRLLSLSKSIFLKNVHDKFIAFKYSRKQYILFFNFLLVGYKKYSKWHSQFEYTL